MDSLFVRGYVLNDSRVIPSPHFIFIGNGRLSPPSSVSKDDRSGGRGLWVTSVSCERTWQALRGET